MKRNIFERKIKDFISSNHLLEHITPSSRRGSARGEATSGGRTPLILALSGGPDSVALLRVFHSLGFNLEAAHCNFHLRGAESDRDETFCKELCAKLNIPLHVIHFDTISYAELHKVSIEMAARDLRYHYFAQLCHDINAEAVCIAHHQDDQIETVLLNIIRGTGLNGLVGMQPKVTMNNWGQPCTFIRPLLCVTEDEIMAYLKALGQDYVIDSTNLQDDAQRNKLRLDIIPMLEKVNPGVKKNIIRMTENLKDVQRIVDDSLDNAQYGNPREGYDMAKIRDFVAPLSLLWHILSPFSFNRTQAEEIINSKTDNKEWSSDEAVALLSRGTLYIVDRRKWEQQRPTLRIPESGLYKYEDGHISIKDIDVDDDFKVSREANKICVDAAKVKYPLILRPVKDGDRFMPFGMHGSKLVGDYLKDRKRNIIVRHRQLVLTDADDNIIWLVGETIDGHYKVVKGKTEKALEITIN